MKPRLGQRHARVTTEGLAEIVGVSAETVRDIAIELVNMLEGLI